MIKNGKWVWVCYACGCDDNCNTDKECVKCGIGITCRQAGGSTWKAGENVCTYRCKCPRLKKGSAECYAINKQL